MAILQWNCRGFSSNFNELGLLAQFFNPQVICLQETHFKQTENYTMRHFTFYNVFSPDPERAMGSASILVRQDVIHSQVPLTTNLFKTIKFDSVCNLAAQAGVRYSLENPKAYVDSNINGFLNVLECCRHHNIKRLVYASSSSVYGNSDAVPFKETANVDYPISLYAATKKSNELMAHTYSHLYDIETIGLRFFTVYGPWGRPDMAMFLFADAIINKRPIKVFNNGELFRDFTFIDDIVVGVVNTLLKDSKNKALNKLYNIGNSSPVKLLDFINAIEKELGISAIKNMLPMQAGDVHQTWADVTQLQQNYNYKSHTTINKGIKTFITWYKKFYYA